MLDLFSATDEKEAVTVLYWYRKGLYLFMILVLALLEVMLTVLFYRFLSVQHTAVRTCVSNFSRKDIN